MATVLLQPRNRCVPDSRHNSTQKHKYYVYIRIKNQKELRTQFYGVLLQAAISYTRTHIYHIQTNGTERHYTIQLHHTSASASGVAYIHKRKHSIIFMDLITNVNFYTHNRRKIDEWKVKTERTKWTANKNLLTHTHTHTTHPFDTYIQNCGRRREEKKLWARDEWTAEPIKWTNTMTTNIHRNLRIRLNLYVLPYAYMYNSWRAHTHCSTSIGVVCKCVFEKKVQRNSSRVTNEKRSKQTDVIQIWKIRLEFASIITITHRTLIYCDKYSNVNEQTERIVCMARVHIFSIEWYKCRRW